MFSAHTHQRTVYQPGEICQWDLQARARSVTAKPARAWIVVCCLGYSRVGASALIFFKEAPDVLWGHEPLFVVDRRSTTPDAWDREGSLHTSRPPTSAGFCGQLTAQREGRGRAAAGDTARRAIPVEHP